MAAGSALSADVRKRIEVTAEHIARNGSDFESTVQQKNLNNPQFAFLYGGEGADYYQQVLSYYRSQQASQPKPAQGGSLLSLLHSHDQTKEQKPVDLADACRRWPEPPVYPLAREVEQQLGNVLGSLEHMASRDAIRSGRLWVECNAAICSQIAGHIMKRLPFLRTSAHRLHVLYLVHDVLQTEAARKDAQRPIITAFKPYLVWMLRPCYQMVQQNAATALEEGSKVLRLLQLWIDRLILTQQEAHELRAIATAADVPKVTAAPQGQTGPSHSRFGEPPIPQVRQQVPISQGIQAHGHMGLGLGNWPMMNMGMNMGMGMGMGMAHAVPQLGASGLGQGGMGQGYKPQMVRGGRQTPETVPVGVMATIQIKLRQRQQTAQMPFVPYRALDLAITPQVLPPMEVPNQRLMERIEDFLEDLKDEDRSSSSSTRSSSRSKSRDRSRSRDTPKAPGFPSLNAVPPPML